MNKVLEYIIRAFDQTKSGTESASRNSESMASRIGRNLMNIKAGWDMLAGTVRTAVNMMAAAARHLWTAVSESFKFETLTVQFSVLMGSMEKARARMKELADFAAKTPFQLNEIVVASRQLHVFSEGALGSKESLNLVGDAAAAVGMKIDELAFWVGRAYSMIKGGQPFGEAAMRLQEMGVMTPQVRQKMEDLQKAGASNAEVWAVLEERMRTFTGGMETLAQTGDGLVSTLKDNWTAAVREFGDAFSIQAKGGILSLSEAINKLNEDGTIAVWADKTVSAMSMVREAADATAKALTFIYQKAGSSDVVASVRALTRATGAVLGGGGLQDVVKQYMSGKATGYYSGKIQAALGDPFGGMAQNTQYAKEAAEAEERSRQKAKARKTEENKTKEQLFAESDYNKRFTAHARGEITLEELNTGRLLTEKEKRDADLAAAQKLNDAKKLAAMEHELRIKNIRKESAEAAKLSGEAQDRLGRARSAAQQAWGWYRDPESFSQQLAAEKSDAAAKKAFEQDFEKLKFRIEKYEPKSNWRTADRLSEREESVRRVALAREEEQAAKQSLAAIEKNTQDLAKKLDELLTMKGGS